MGKLKKYSIILTRYISDKKEELRKASNAKKRKELQFLKSQMEKDLQVGPFSNIL